MDTTLLSHYSHLYLPILCHVFALRQKKKNGKFACSRFCYEIAGDVLLIF